MQLPKFQKPDPLTLMIIAGVALIIVLGGYLGNLVLKNKAISLPTLPVISLPATSGAKYTSPYALDFGMPIYSFSGIVERATDKDVWLKQEVNPSSAMMPPIPAMANATPTPTPQKPRVITLHLKISDTTSVSRQTSLIPYLLKQNTPPMTPPTSEKAKVQAGDTISFTSTTDLRTTNPDNVPVNSISISPEPNMINGRVVSISGNTIKMKGIYNTSMPMPMTTPIPEKEYTVTVDKDTEISQYSMMAAAATNQTNQNKRLSISDIKTDMNLTVYSDQNVAKSTTITAKLIIVPQSMPTPATPPVPAEPPVTAIPSPTAATPTP